VAKRLFIDSFKHDWTSSEPPSNLTAQPATPKALPLARSHVRKISAGQMKGVISHDECTALFHHEGFI